MAIITISRGTLSGGKDLSQRLGEKLGYRVISREIVVDAAKTYGVAEDKLLAELEHAPGLWARMTGHEERYVLALQATLADHVSTGNVVYHGLAGRFLLDGLPGVMRVRLIAPMSYRVSAAAAQLGISREQAVQHIRKVDHEREKWVQSLYGEDWADPSHYDVTINLGDMSMDTAANMVGCLVSSKEFAWNDDAKRVVNDFALKTRVRAHLRFLSPWPDLVVNVQVKNGVVRLSGDSTFETLKNDVERFVENIQGVTHLVHAGEVVEAQPKETKELLAKEVMIPLLRYPHVKDTVTLREAIGAISSSAVRLEDGFIIAPRYVLVFDGADALVGVVSRRDILRGLAPGYLNVKHALEHVPGVMPTMADGFEQNFAWNSLFSFGALNNAREPVKQIMNPPVALVSVTDTVGTVVGAMLQHRVDLVPVLDGGRVVGVVLMTDIFDNVAQYVMEGGGS